MAKTTINPLQLKITGSLAATIAEDGTFGPTYHFLTQKSGSLVETVSADVMQAYFSKTDLTEAASQNEGMRLVFAARSSGDLDDEDLFVDTDVLTYNPSTTTFVVPHIEVGDDLAMKSDAAVISFGADADVTLTHVADTGLLLNSDMQLQFRDSTEYINSDADGSMNIRAATDIALNINGTDELLINASTATFGTNIVIPDAGTIGSASDADAIAISSGGVVSLSATTEASAIGTAALVVAGGASVAKDLYVGDDLELDSDGAKLGFGADSDVSLTHVADTGLLLNSSRALQFGDAATAINQSSDGVLSINADGTLDLNGGALDGDFTSINLSASGGGFPDITLSASGSISLDAASSVQISGDGGLNLYANQNSANQYTNIAAYSGMSGSITLARGATGPSVIIGQAASNRVQVSGAYMAIVDASAASSTTTGALRVKGGISTEADLYVGDDLRLDSDGAVLGIGADDDVTITHDGSTGATLASAGAFLIDGAAAVSIDGASGVNIGTNDSGAAISIGHSTSEVTVNDNLTVTGDLTVNGATTTISTTNMVVEDALIELSTGLSGSPSNDAGLIIERGSSDNAALIWDESEDSFQFGTTSATGASTGNLTVADASLRVANLDASGDMTAATITMSGFTVDTDGDTALKTLAVDDGSTIGCDSDTDLLTLSAQSVVVAADSAITYKGTAVTSTGLELNQVDGDTSATDITVASGDRVVYNDNGTMMQVAVDKLGVYYGSGDGIQATSAGVLSLEPIIKTFHGSGSLTAGISASFGADVPINAAGIQVYLNGMLQTPSASSGLGSKIFDYHVSGLGGNSPAIVFESGVVDNDDAVVIHYIKK